MAFVPHGTLIDADLNTVAKQFLCDTNRPKERGPFRLRTDLRTDDLLVTRTGHRKQGGHAAKIGSGMPWGCPGVC